MQDWLGSATWMVAAIVLSGCQPIIRDRFPQRVVPLAPLISFDGPFASETLACEHARAALRAEDVYAAEPRCDVLARSFEGPPPGQPKALDRIAGDDRFRSVHVAALRDPGDEHDRVVRCLLVIETPRGWFTSGQMIENCESPGSGSPFHPIGGFELDDVTGDLEDELLITRGEWHGLPCGDCSRSRKLARAVCGLDRAGAPRCTPPTPTLVTDPDGELERTWAARDGRLILGSFPRRGDDGKFAPVAGEVRWRLAFD